MAFNLVVNWTYISKIDAFQRLLNCVFLELQAAMHRPHLFWYVEITAQVSNSHQLGGFWISSSSTIHPLASLQSVAWMVRVSVFSFSKNYLLKVAIELCSFEVYLEHDPKWISRNFPPKKGMRRSHRGFFFCVFFFSLDLRIQILRSQLVEGSSQEGLGWVSQGFPVEAIDMFIRKCPSRSFGDYKHQKDKVTRFDFGKCSTLVSVNPGQ